MEKKALCSWVYKYTTAESSWTKYYIPIICTEMLVEGGGEEQLREYNKNLAEPLGHTMNGEALC